ncbi:charged multivesicular body protein 7 isoform X2 [Bacillus rossius redtenbacheri]|uniref:charged multivesicular body protein 7 isoform X2 n=1 Tax=Bacillus rossius redtenbacheri TaxID=93214 RepID=UPI002FDDDA9D
MSGNIMPDCWNDDIRMGALFSPFRKRSANPLDWESKLKFWESLIEKWCVCNKRSKISLQLLKKEFQRNGTTPLCLEIVVEEMLKNGTLVLHSDFVKFVPRETWTAWVVDMVVKRPAVWTFSKVLEALVSSSIEDETEYVHLPAIKAEALASARSGGGLWEVGDGEEETALAAHWLRRQGRAALCRAPGGGPLLVKLGGAELTELDLGRHALRCSERTLERHVEELEEQQGAARDQAREYLRRGMRHMAKSCLRKRRQLDQCAEKRLSALENVRHLLARLQDTESDAQVLEAYRTGVSALRRALGEAGLTEDTAATAVLQVQEVLDVHDEINAALSQPIGSSVEEDLERELEGLLGDVASGPPSAPSPGSGTAAPETNAAVRNKDGAPAIVLPEVPSHEPSSPGRLLSA